MRGIKFKSLGKHVWMHLSVYKHSNPHGGLGGTLRSLCGIRRSQRQRRLLAYKAHAPLAVWQYGARKLWQWLGRCTVEPLLEGDDAAVQESTNE